MQKWSDKLFGNTTKRRNDLDYYYKISSLNQRVLAYDKSAELITRYRLLALHSILENEVKPLGNNEAQENEFIHSHQIPTRPSTCITKLFAKENSELLETVH
jgi:hypothetical protein